MLSFLPAAGARGRARGGQHQPAGLPLQGRPACTQQTPRQPAVVDCALVSLLLVWVSGCSAQPARQPPPSILFVLADDLGYANVAWTRHGDDADGEVRTPVMDGLVAQGIELTRAYAWGLCAPSRAAMQSGRHPLHVNVENVDVMNYNPDDPVSGYQGIPLGMVTLPQLLAPAGYRSYFYGKWDVGMATAAHTALGRGYNKSLSYFHHHVDYWTGVYPQEDSGPIGYFPECLAVSPELGAGFRPVDLWEHSADGTEGPAVGRLSDRNECDSSVGGTGTWVPEWCLGVSAEAEAACPAYPVREGCAYIDDVFAAEAAAAITAHVSEPNPGPFMLIFAAHGVHAPLQLPRSRLARVAIHPEYPDWRRRRYAGMVTQFDEHVGLLVDAMRAGGSWDNSLVVMSSDNGGPLYNNGAPGASNWPLRGGKASNFDGGIRVPSFVSGGAVPERARGTQRDGLVTLWDWYATWASLAGVDANDPAAEAASVARGLPPVGDDSVNQWPYLTVRALHFPLSHSFPHTNLNSPCAEQGEVAVSPRRSIALGDTTGTFFATNGHFGGDAVCPTNTSSLITRFLIQLETISPCAEQYTSGMLVDEREADGTGRLWKLLTRKQVWSGWGGRLFPNATTAADPAPFVSAPHDIHCTDM